VRIALFANDQFGSYVFDTVRAGPGELVCAVGETSSLVGRATGRLRRLAARPSRLLGMIRGRFARDAEPPRDNSRSPAAGLPPLAEACSAHGVPFFEDYLLRRPSFAQTLRSFDLDLILVATFGAILGPNIIATPSRGIVNIHFALLPKYRGMTPELCALLDGAMETGVTAHFIDEGIDTGDIIAQRRVAIDRDHGFADLQAALYPLGRELVGEVLASFEAGPVEARPQDESAASMCRLRAGFRAISPTETPAAEIHNILRACLGTRLPPYVVQDDGQHLYLLEAEFILDSAGTAPRDPGRIVAHGDPSDTGRIVARGDPSDTRRIVAHGDPSDTRRIVAHGDPSDTGRIVAHGDPSDTRRIVAHGDPPDTRRIVCRDGELLIRRAWMCGREV